MTHRSVALVHAGSEALAATGIGAWTPDRKFGATKFGSAEFGSGATERVAKPSCPMKIIFRGVVVLSLLSGGLGLALGKFGPDDHMSFVRPSNPIFAIPGLKLASLQPSDPASPVEAADAPLDANPVLAAADAQNPQIRKSFLNLLQSALDSRRNTVQFGPVKVKRDIVQTIIRAAQDTGTDPVLLMAIADKESSFDADVSARTSSAMGLFQFVDATWLKAVRDFGAAHGLGKQASEIAGSEDRPNVADAAEKQRILALRKDPYLSAVLAAELLKRNGEKIAERIGRGLTGGETYLAHFLGPNDAERFMEKVVGQPEYKAAALLPRPAHANASIFYDKGRRSHGLSVAAVHDKFEEMMGRRIDRYRSVATDAGLTAFLDSDTN